MIAVIVRKELTEAARDGRLRILALLLLLLVVAAALSGYQQLREYTAAQTAAQGQEQQRWLEQGEKHPHAAAHYGIYAFRPRGALAYFEPGIDAEVGLTVWMEAHRQNEAQYRPARDSGEWRRFAPLNAGFLLGALLPLLLLAWAASSVSAEREAGTLRQLLAQGVPPRRLLWGKWLACAALLLLVLPLWLLFTVLVLHLEATPDALARVALLGPVLLLYLVALLSLGVAVSALARSEGTALAIVLVFWLLTTLVAPRLLMEWASWRLPLPSGIEFRQALAADLDDKSEVEAELARRTAALLDEHGVSDPAQLPLNLDGLRLHLDDRHGYTVFDRHFGALHDRYQTQEQWLQRAGLVAPALAWQALASGLAGTDQRHYRHFIDSAEHYRRDLQERMSAAIIANPEAPGERYLGDGELWAEVPPFHYHPPGLGDILHYYRAGLAALLMWLLLGVLALEAAAWRLRRVAP